MKTISVSSRSRSVNDLLKQARRGMVILQAADGQQFALTPLTEWAEFEVGNDRSFAEEVQRTAKNRKLMNYLARRKQSEKPPGLPLSEVKRRLGIK